MFPLPPITETVAGKERRIGIEIEFSGLDPRQAAELVRDCFGGECRQSDLYKWEVVDTGLGRFEVELDTQYVHEGGIPAQDKLEEASAQLAEGVRKAVGSLAEAVVPTEIVSAPVRMSELAAFDRLIERLRDEGARDNRDNPVYAFGLHLNPELAGKSVRHILPTLKAYLLLSPWLREEIGVDLMRRLLPHVDPFPEDYVSSVAAPSYEPRMPRLIDDYLAANPTRNRELDMLPCFAAIDEERVRRVIDDPRIKPRPAFHYRLPEAQIADPGWSLVLEWSRWVTVERLANDADLLAEIAERYRETGRPDWPRAAARFIAAHKLAD